MYNISMKNKERAKNNRTLTLLIEEIESLKSKLATEETLKENLGEPISKNDWGNGFKIFVEYDFTHKTNRILPIVGINWKFMPRGNKCYDNIFTLYCMVKL